MLFGEMLFAVSRRRRLKRSEIFGWPCNFLESLSDDVDNNNDSSNNNSSNKMGSSNTNNNDSCNIINNNDCSNINNDNNNDKFESEIQVEGKKVSEGKT